MRRLGKLFLHEGLPMRWRLEASEARPAESAWGQACGARGKHDLQDFRLGFWLRVPHFLFIFCYSLAHLLSGPCSAEQPERHSSRNKKYGAHNWNMWLKAWWRIQMKNTFLYIEVRFNNIIAHFSWRWWTKYSNARSTCPSSGSTPAPARTAWTRRPSPACASTAATRSTGRTASAATARFPHSKATRKMNNP